MKKYILLSALSLAMLGWSACQEENEAALNVAPNGKSLTFTASVSGSNSLSKTAIAANGKSIVFTDGESMSVIPNVGDAFTISNSADDVTSFRGIAGGEAYEKATSFVAMYPSGALENGEYVMTIPQAQYVVSGSFDPKSNLLVAETNNKDMSLQMHNVCSYIRVNIDSEVLCIKVCADQPLSGKVSVSSDGSVKMLEGESVVTLEGNITPGIYYIAVMPGKVSKLMIYTDNEDIKPIEVEEFEFVRGQIHGVGIDAVKLLSPADIVDYVNASDEEIVTLNMPLETYDHTDVMVEISKITDKKVKLVIPEGVKELGIDWQKLKDGNFIMLPHPSALVDVVIPESVETIGEGAFYACISLTNITIPESVTTIGSEAFRGCVSLTNIIIPEGVTEIGNQAFYNCCSLTSISIPESVTTIGESAFLYCSSLTSISIPESVTTIGERAFFNCSSLTSITIPEGVTTIGDGAFCVCSSLTSITISEGVETIGYMAFTGCSSLTSITIPESVTSIGDYAFDDCDNLEAIYCSQAIYDEYHKEYPQMVLYYGTKPSELIDLTDDEDDFPFGKWDTWVAGGSITEAKVPVYNVDPDGEELGDIYGDGTVNAYVDLSDCKSLQITLKKKELEDGTIVTPRALLNRDMEEGQAPDHLIDLGMNADQKALYQTEVENEDGTITFIVDLEKIVADKGFAHLHSIKIAKWQTAVCTKLQVEKK